MYIRIVTGMGKGCPIPLLLYHTGMMSFSNRILIRRLSFLHHVATLPLRTLARDTYETMSRHQLPGLATQLTPVMQELGLSNMQAHSKNSWKRIVKKKIIERQKEQLLQQAETYKKISAEQLNKDEFGVQEYFSTLTVPQARLRLKLAGGMCPRVATLYPSDRRYQSINFQCLACRAAGRPVSETRDTVQHITECIFYEKFKCGLSLNTDIGLVTFMKRVIDDRAEYEDSMSTLPSG